MKKVFRQKIIDAHHHFWNYDSNKYTWLKASKNKKFHRSYLPEDLLNDSGDLRLIKTVHVQCEIDREFNIYETEWLQNISDSRKDNFPNAIIAYIDLSKNGIEQIIEKHKNFKNFRGFRQILRFNESNQALTDAKINYLKNDIWINNLAYLQSNDLIFELLCYYNQFEDALKVIKKYHNIRFVINHSFWPFEINNTNFNIWQNAINRLSEFPNVFIKLSGFGELFPSWTKEKIRPFIDSALENFGVNRLMFGSNFPVDKFTSNKNYIDYWETYFDITKNLTNNELDKIFYRNAEIIYKI